MTNTNIEHEYFKWLCEKITPNHCDFQHESLLSILNDIDFVIAIGIPDIINDDNRASNGINLTNALPMSDEQGMALAGDNNTFDFTIAATINGSGTTTINYAITGTKESDSTLADSAIKVYLTDITSGSESQVLAPTKISSLTTTTSGENSGAPSGQYELATGNTTQSFTQKYRLRMWVADDFSDLDASGTYKLRVNVYGAAAAQ